jgi:hypothetical protein
MERGVDEPKRATLRRAGRRPITPLWTIALFVTFSETVLGVAAAQTQGGVQVALTCFVICFPLLVAVAFYATLWFRPLNLYAPGDYAGGNFEAFAKALRGVEEAVEQGASRVERLENNISDILIATVLDAYEYVTLQKIAGADRDGSYFFNSPEGQNLLERLRNRGLVAERHGGMFDNRTDRNINVRDHFVITPLGEKFLRAADARGLGQELRRIVVPAG